MRLIIIVTISEGGCRMARPIGHEIKINKEADKILREIYARRNNRLNAPNIPQNVMNDQFGVIVEHEKHPFDSLFNLAQRSIGNDETLNKSEEYCYSHKLTDDETIKVLGCLIGLALS